VLSEVSEVPATTHVLGAEDSKNLVSDYPCYHDFTS